MKLSNLRQNQFMDSNSIRLNIIQWVLQEDDEERLARLASLVEDLRFEHSSASEVLGVRPNGTEVTKAELLRCIRLAEEQAERGEVMSLDELIKTAENW